MDKPKTPPRVNDDKMRAVANQLAEIKKKIEDLADTYKMLNDAERLVAGTIVIGIDSAWAGQIVALTGFVGSPPLAMNLIDLIIKRLQQSVQRPPNFPPMPTGTDKTIN